MNMFVRGAVIVGLSGLSCAGASAAAGGVADALAYELAQALTADDGLNGDQHGWAVAISGTTAMVGAANAAIDGNPRQGAVYVYTFANGAWTQTQKLLADDGVGDDRFGATIALSDSTVLISAITATIDDAEGQGAVYVFRRSGDTWSQSQKLVSSDGLAGDDFGFAVRLEGTTALIGAPYADLGSNGSQGAAYVFTETAGTWTQTQKLVASDGQANELFGEAIALEGSRALISAFQGAHNGVHPGVVYAFNASGGSWSEGAKLVASDAADGDQFGGVVALSGSNAIISAMGATIGANARQGAAYIFSDSGGNWSEQAKLAAPDGIANDNLGYSVALNDGIALIGAPFVMVDSLPAQGAVYRFVEDGGAWGFDQKITASDGGVPAFFGWSVTLNDDGMMIGAVGRNGMTGAAHVYTSDRIFDDGFDTGA